MTIDIQIFLVGKAKRVSILIKIKLNIYTLPLNDLLN